jgi:hypothetical protein
MPTHRSFDRLYTCRCYSCIMSANNQTRSLIVPEIGTMSTKGLNSWSMRWLDDQGCKLINEERIMNELHRGSISSPQHHASRTTLSAVRPFVVSYLVKLSATHSGPAGCNVGTSSEVCSMSKTSRITENTIHRRRKRAGACSFEVIEDANK